MTVKDNDCFMKLHTIQWFHGQHAKGSTPLHDNPTSCVYGTGHYNGHYSDFC